jgi:transcription-repair coupling factor (superfamily II helicase)
MDLSRLLDSLRALPGYRTILHSLRAGESTGGILGVPRAVRAPLAALLAADLERPVLVIVPGAERMATLGDELPAWSHGLPVRTFPEPGPLFYEAAPWGPRTIRQRVSTLAALSTGRQPGAPPESVRVAKGLYLATARSLMTRTLPPRDFLAASRLLSVGGTTRIDQLLTHLVGIGYAPASLVTEPGEISRRGGILDIWPPSESHPVRIELFGDQIDSMRSFDPATQRSTGTLPRLRLTSAREALPRLVTDSMHAFLPDALRGDDQAAPRVLEYLLPWMTATPASLLDYLPEDSVILLEDAAGIEQTVDELEEQAVALRAEQHAAGHLPDDAPLPYLTLPDLKEAWTDRDALDLGLLSGSPAEASVLRDSFHVGPRFGGQLRPLMDYLLDRRTSGDVTIVVSRQSPRLVELWSDLDPGAELSPSLPPDLQPGDLFFLSGALAEGWILRGPARDSSVHLLTDGEIFGWAKPRARARTPVRAVSPESPHADLAPGDLVVHVDYGIGRFQGLVERTLEGLRREFLLLEYADGDQLFVPIHQADRVSRYVGVDSSPPHLSRLGGQEWDHTKSRAREAVEEVARDLLDLYTKRMNAAGHAFSSDTPWQQELEASFPYTETDDQMRAIEMVKRDMERGRPMDRLICGDVGYGKTEVGLRAAFKAVMGGKQVAVLVPTTVLAQQHFNTFRQRLAAFPVVVEMLSRFRTRQEMQAILDRLAAGEVDILIGTHRLLQRDVEFRDLGLVIVDEEQRFGVTHKEYLKRLRTEVDVLTMTATPIPRTLYMALSGARDISTINTPPEERLPIVTHVGPFDVRVARQAILRELDRDGQVFFVHNRVHSIGAIRRRLEGLVPEARLGVAHGQMPERELAEIMERFTAGDIDVLISTSIIESGLDFPNANTLIVDRADTFGLAQLYQLRGRIGRGTARGFAYFFRHPHFRATPESLERLEIIAEHTQLGAGYGIAMRDLEMRGAGEVLGTRQHGHIAAVGFHLYTRLLASAVERGKVQMGVSLLDSGRLDLETAPLAVTIDLPVPGSIPASFLPDRGLRLNLYRRMARLRRADQIASLREELQDRFGPLPEELTNLIQQLELKLAASRAGVESISAEGSQILVQLSGEPEERHLPPLGDDVRESKRGLWLPRQGDWIRRLFDVLETLSASRAEAPSAADPAA